MNVFVIVASLGGEFHLSEYFFSRLEAETECEKKATHDESYRWEVHEVEKGRE